jgi:hypothetical protein
MTVTMYSPEEFFLVKHRDGLPQAPACNACNGEKSALEHYLTTNLPFRGRHRDPVVNLQTMVPKENPLRHRWQDEEGQNLLGNALLGRIDRPSGGSYGHLRR